MFKSKKLPSSCPPQDADSTSDGEILRLVEKNPATEDDFVGGDFGGRQRPNHADECQWEGLSVMAEETPWEVVKSYQKCPRLRHMKFVAAVSINKASGRIKCYNPKKAEHLCFWPYAGFQAEDSVVSYEPI